MPDVPTQRDYLKRINSVLWGGRHPLPEGYQRVYGAAFRDGIYGVRRGALLVTTDYYRFSVSVIVPADGKILPGCQDSCARGNPMPQPADGVKLIPVNGEPGPWWAELDSLLVELAEAQGRHMEAKAAKEATERNAMATQREQELVSARAALAGKDGTNA